MKIIKKERKSENQEDPKKTQQLNALWYLSWMTNEKKDIKKNLRKCELTMDFI